MKGFTNLKTRLVNNWLLLIGLFAGETMDPRISGGSLQLREGEPLGLVTVQMDR